MGVRHFLPMTRFVRFQGRRKVDSPIPLFPGYLFLQGSLDDCYAADRTGRVAQILPVADQARLNAQLGAIAQVLRITNVLHPSPPLSRGMVVEVIAGPFKGVRGRVDVTARENRLVLNVDALANAAVLEIDRDLLQPVSAS
jgi:transcriptional antiterminator NusG